MQHYRLTPEHSHPAQADDAFSSWQYLRQTFSADDLVLIGDSAGGHMVLLLLQTLHTLKQAQPSLCIAICPWTDIGERGESMTSNNRFDLVQGWMAIRFGEWLDPDKRYGRENLSPISYDYAGLAPLYVQVGGREVLRDMIVEFADVQAANGADVMLDLWDDMPHNFPAYDSLFNSSTQAVERISELLVRRSNPLYQLSYLPDVTRVAQGCFISMAQPNQS